MTSYQIVGTGDNYNSGPRFVKSNYVHYEGELIVFYDVKIYTPKLVISARNFYVVKED